MAYLVALLLLTVVSCSPIKLASEYPHVFEYNGKYMQLFATPEHYGAVVNTAFNYTTYLHTLHTDGLNYARTWSGTYRERPGSFGIVNNTLDAPPNHYLAPWKRSTTCCYADGGNKFDLNQWDPAYFARLKSYLTLANSLDIIIEFSLFCDYYGHPSTWEWSPLYWENNINDVPHTEHGSDPYELKKYPQFTKIWTAVVEKIVTELNDVDNLFYEVSNEMWDMKYYPFRQLMLQTIKQTEKSLPKQHLVSDTIAIPGRTGNYTAKDLDIWNLHNGVAWYLKRFVDQLPKNAVDSDEDAFGLRYEPYRYTCYTVILSGGGAYNNIDYSFQVGFEDGTGTPTFTGGYKGSGGIQLRRQIAQCRKFFDATDVINMRPNSSVATLVAPTTGLNITSAGHVHGMEYAVYLGASNVYYDSFKGIETFNSTVQLNILPHEYEVTWINATSGAVVKSGEVLGPTPKLISPPFVVDIVLYLKRKTPA